MEVGLTALSPPTGTIPSSAMRTTARHVPRQAARPRLQVTVIGRPPPSLPSSPAPHSRSSTCSKPENRVRYRAKIELSAATPKSSRCRAGMGGCSTRNPAYSITRCRRSGSTNGTTGEQLLARMLGRATRGRGQRRHACSATGGPRPVDGLSDAGGRQAPGRAAPVVRAAVFDVKNRRVALASRHPQDRFLKCNSMGPNTLERSSVDRACSCGVAVILLCWRRDLSLPAAAAQDLPGFCSINHFAVDAARTPDGQARLVERKTRHPLSPGLPGNPHAKGYPRGSVTGAAALVR
jgi:hypothetical protein